MVFHGYTILHHAPISPAKRYNIILYQTTKKGRRRVSAIADPTFLLVVLSIQTFDPDFTFDKVTTMKMQMDIIVHELHGNI